MVVLIIVIMVVITEAAAHVVDAGLSQLLEHLGKVRELGLHLLVGEVVRLRRVPGCKTEAEMIDLRPDNFKARGCSSSET